MEYEFYVGDYVETKFGSKGYICDAKTLQWKCMRAGVDGFSEGTIYNIFCAGDVERFYNRIGKYEFTEAEHCKAKGKIEHLTQFLASDSGQYFVGCYETIKKINELVDAVNELRMRDAKEKKDD